MDHRPREGAGRYGADGQIGYRSTAGRVAGAERGIGKVERLFRERVAAFGAMGAGTAAEVVAALRALRTVKLSSIDVSTNGDGTTDDGADERERSAPEACQHVGEAWTRITLRRRGEGCGGIVDRNGRSEQ